MGLPLLKFIISAMTDFDKFLDGDVPRRASCVYISQLIGFAVTGFNARNKCLKTKLLQQAAIGIINFEKHVLKFILDTMN